MSSPKDRSKLISLILRHNPGLIDLKLDENGWANVEDMIQKINAYGTTMDLHSLEYIVLNNDKKRFSFNEDKTMIRANQGHSIDVDLNLKQATPSGVLYHGTARRLLDSIMETGLKKHKRHHVHLTESIDIARSVGIRHGSPVILEVNAPAMHLENWKFYLSENNVWLVDEIPVQFLRVVS
jgi:putative RNA 2'-phosphotransferase